MKLIIDIPDHLYNIIRNHGCITKSMLTKAIANGIPLDKIIVEIRKKMRFDSFNEGIVSYDDISKIFDKYETKSGDL